MPPPPSDSNNNQSHPNITNRPHVTPYSTIQVHRKMGGHQSRNSPSDLRLRTPFRKDSSFKAYDPKNRSPFDIGAPVEEIDAYNALPICNLHTLLIPTAGLTELQIQDNLSLWLYGGNFSHEQWLHFPIHASFQPSSYFSLIKITHPSDLDQFHHVDDVSTYFHRVLSPAHAQKLPTRNGLWNRYIWFRFILENKFIYCGDRALTVLDGSSVFSMFDNRSITRPCLQFQRPSAPWNLDLTPGGDGTPLTALDLTTLSEDNPKYVLLHHPLLFDAPLLFDDSTRTLLPFLFYDRSFLQSPNMIHFTVKPYQLSLLRTSDLHFAQSSLIQTPTPPTSLHTTSTGSHSIHQTTQIPYMLLDLDLTSPNTPSLLNSFLFFLLLLANSGSPLFNPNIPVIIMISNIDHLDQASITPDQILAEFSHLSPLTCPPIIRFTHPMPKAPLSNVKPVSIPVLTPKFNVTDQKDQQDFVLPKLTLHNPDSATGLPPTELRPDEALKKQRELASFFHILLLNALNGWIPNSPARTVPSHSPSPLTMVDLNTLCEQSHHQSQSNHNQFLAGPLSTHLLAQRIPTPRPLSHHSSLLPLYQSLSPQHINRLTNFAEMARMGFKALQLSTLTFVVGNGAAVGEEFTSLQNDQLCPTYNATVSMLALQFARMVSIAPSSPTTTTGTTTARPIQLYTHSIDHLVTVSTTQTTASNISTNTTPHSTSTNAYANLTRAWNQPEWLHTIFSPNGEGEGVETDQHTDCFNSTPHHITMLPPSNETTVTRVAPDELEADPTAMPVDWKATGHHQRQDITVQLTNASPTLMHFPHPETHPKDHVIHTKSSTHQKQPTHQHPSTPNPHSDYYTASISHFQAPKVLTDLHQTQSINGTPQPQQDNAEKTQDLSIACLSADPHHCTFIHQAKHPVAALFPSSHCALPLDKIRAINHHLVATQCQPSQEADTTSVASGDMSVHQQLDQHGHPILPSGNQAPSSPSPSSPTASSQKLLIQVDNMITVSLEAQPYLNLAANHPHTCAALYALSFYNPTAPLDHGSLSYLELEPPEEEPMAQAQLKTQTNPAKPPLRIPLLPQSASINAVDSSVPLFIITVVPIGFDMRHSQFHSVAPPESPLPLTVLPAVTNIPLFDDIPIAERLSRQGRDKQAQTNLLRAPLVAPRCAICPEAISPALDSPHTPSSPSQSSPLADAQLTPEITDTQFDPPPHNIDTVSNHRLVLFQHMMQTEQLLIPPELFATTTPASEQATPTSACKDGMDRIRGTPRTVYHFVVAGFAGYVAALPALNQCALAHWAAQCAAADEALRQ